MYTIVPFKKKVKMEFHDYTFKDFDSFYRLANVVTVPLMGKYSMGIVTSKVQDIYDFIKIQNKYACLIIYIYAPESVVDYITLYNIALPIKDIVSPFEQFKEMVVERRLLFAKNTINLLYSSIEHKPEDMEEVLDKLLNEYGQQVQITEEMLAKLFILNKVTYPRTVLISFIQMDRWRYSKLNKCVNEIGNDVMLGAMVKNIKTFIMEKGNYYKTGKGTNIIKSLNTNNLLQMYRIFVVERNGLNDVCLLLSLYERSTSAYDIVQREFN